MKVAARFLLVLLVAVLSTSCFTQPDCVVTANMEIKIDFKQNKLNSRSNTRSVVDTFLRFQSIKISIAGKDSLFSLDTIPRSSLTLPIDPNQSTMKYTFVRRGRQASSPLVTESITFTYSNETRIISAQCGAFVYFLNLNVTESSYGSQFKILNDRLLKNTTNVQILF